MFRRSSRAVPTPDARDRAAHALLKWSRMLRTAKHRLLLAAIPLSLSSSHLAHAQDTDGVSRAAEQSRGVPAGDWRISGFVGGYETDDAGGVSLGAIAKVRSGWLVGGAMVDFGGALLADNYVGGALMGGVGTRLDRHVRLELLALGGYRHYSGVGKDILFDGDPGASAGLPFVGGRAGASYLFGKRRKHFELGVYGSYDRDLYEKRVRYSYLDESGGFFGDDGEVRRYTSDQTIGWSRIGLGVELGGTHDWF